MRADDIEFVKPVGIKQSGDSVSLAYKKDTQHKELLGGLFQKYRQRYTLYASWCSYLGT